MKRDYLCGALALALLVLGASDAFAETKTFAWDAPTTRDDGAPLTVDELDFYELECNGVPVTTFPGEAETGLVDMLNGAYTCALYAVDVDGLRSDMSNEVFFTIASPPSPPTDFSVD
jgi:hypothetical protein